jgi:UDP-glucose 4-epimerase
MPRTLVTGGLGFIGSHLVERLVNRGEEVWIVDDCSTSVVDPEHFASHCQVVVANLAEMDLGELGPFERIFHLADIAGPARVIQHPGRLGPAFVQSLTTVLAAATPGRTRVTMVSSSEVYGRAGDHREDTTAWLAYPPTRRAEYAAAKALCEVVALNHGRALDVAVNVVRPFNVAGPRQSPLGGFVVPRFVLAALRGDALTVFGNGRQRRCFTHVADTVDSILAVADSDVSDEIFNSGNPANDTAIGDLARRVLDVCELVASIVHVDPTDVFGPDYTESFDKTPNIDKIGATLGWRPARGINEVIADVHRYYLGIGGGGEQRCSA